MWDACLNNLVSLCISYFYIDEDKKVLINLSEKYKRKEYKEKFPMHSFFLLNFFLINSEAAVASFHNRFLSSFNSLIVQSFYKTEINCFLCILKRFRLGKNLRVVCLSHKKTTFWVKKSVSFIKLKKGVTRLKNNP